jgi:hypothetical protein
MAPPAATSSSASWRNRTITDRIDLLKNAAAAFEGVLAFTGLWWDLGLDETQDGAPPRRGRR